MSGAGVPFCGDGEDEGTMMIADCRAREAHPVWINETHPFPLPPNSHSLPDERFKFECARKASPVRMDPGLSGSMRRILSGYLQIPIHSLSCVFSLPSHFFGMLIQFTNRRKTNHATTPLEKRSSFFIYPFSSRALTIFPPEAHRSYIDFQPGELRYCN